MNILVKRTIDEGYRMKGKTMALRIFSNIGHNLKLGSKEKRSKK